MRFEVCSALLLLGSATSSNAQPATPDAPRERTWLYEAGIGLAATDLGGWDDFHFCMGVRLAVGRSITPEVVMAFRLSWNMELLDDYRHHLEPHPTQFSAFAGPSLGSWFGDHVFLAGTGGASLIHLETYGEYTRDYSATAFAYGGTAGFSLFADRGDTATISVDAIRALDEEATTTISLLVSFQPF